MSGNSSGTNAVTSQPSLMSGNSSGTNGVPSQPGVIRKATSVTTPAHANFPTAMREE